MAITEAQRNQIAKILKQTPETVLQQITYLGALVTAQVETDIAVELARWVDKGGKFIEIEPKESNRGVKISSDNDKDDIKDNIALLLQRSDWMSGSSSGYSFTVTR